MTARTRLAFLFLLAAVASLAVPATVGATAARPAAAEPPPEVTIQIVALRMVPDRVEITTGTTVTWVNNEAADYPVAGGAHQLAADDASWSSPPIAPGTRWSRRFDQPGAVGYHSAGHPTATGQLVVTGEPVVDRPVEQEVTITEDNPDDPTSWGFEPADLVIEAGTTVVWRNNGKNVHTVSADDESFESGDIAPGATWRHTFEAPGAFAYHCTPHPWMKGQIRIVAPGADAPPPSPADGHDEHVAPPAPRTAAATERVGQGPVRHEVAIVEPDPAKPFDWAFEPAALDVKVGDTVVWRNAGTVEHSVTGPAFDSGLVKPAASWERAFDTTGVFDYHCTPHPWMKGVVRVTTLDAVALPPLAAAATGGAGTSPPARAAEATRTGDGPVRHEALIVEPDVAQPMEWRFDPPTLDVRAGDTVVWRNTGTVQHTVTADSATFDSGLLDPGRTFEFRFDRPGVYAYHCTPHPWMQAVVRVTDASGAEPPVVAAVGPTEQAGPGPTPEVPSAGRIGLVRVPPGPSYRPSMILPEALALSFLIIAVSIFLAGAPWGRRAGGDPLAG
jgi:plastocyanin